MINPLAPIARFGFYLAALGIGIGITWLETESAVATLGAVQTAALTLAAARVPLGKRGHHAR